METPGGYRVDRSLFKNAPEWEHYVCPKCHLLLRDAVQTSCGHWLCQVCVDSLFKRHRFPQCPDCSDRLVEAECFPDRFVRREIQNLSVHCTHGCDWEGIFKDFDCITANYLHTRRCQFKCEECKCCGMSISILEVDEHICQCIQLDHLVHVSQSPVQPYSPRLSSSYQGLNTSQPVPFQAPFSGFSFNSGSFIPASNNMVSQRLLNLRDDVDQDEPEPHLKSRFTALEEVHDQKKDVLTHAKSMTELKMTVTPPHSQFESGPAVSVLQKQVSKHVSSLRDEMNRKLSSIADEARRREEDIVNLKVSVSKLEKMVRAKNAEIEDRDLRLSLIKNSNYDGTMVWKIPQFSQCMEDAKSGKYTSIFSLPFYTNRYGYKMCLRLYILGDGIGKGSHMSLFFVIMRGEFDNLLQWPFTHIVTFRLINQTGAQDITDTFQPDPMSSSFKKPKSDMNIASGCPRFVSLDDLQSGGFIVDETVFIKCTVDKTTIRNP